MKAITIVTVFIKAVSIFVPFAKATDVDPIVIKGSKFFYETNGTQFYIKGVAYQQGVSTDISEDASDDYTDPLADVDSCKRDIPNLVDLQTNTIRVYAVDPELDHDECMSMLADAGIYVVADLSEPGTSIVRNNPTWNEELYVRYTSVVDEMAQYSNTLGFFAGNEVSNMPNNTDASAFVKAAVRDMKSYIKAKDYRAIGVGYATNDDAEIRDDLAAYFNCNDEDESIDFWGYNIYSWCGDSSFTESGYDSRTEEFESYSVPVFLAEYGCNEVQPREFGDVPVLYGDKMSDVWSGGIIYMYFEEENNYGLVKVKSDDTVSKLADYTSLSSQMAKVTVTGVKMDEYSPTNTDLAECPDVGGSWEAEADPLPPSPNADLCSCMVASLSCVVDSSVDTDDFSDLFGTICETDDLCAGIAANATTGEYGAYSMCNAKDQLSFVLDQYYQAQDSADTACDFDGSASLQTAVSPEGDCSNMMAEAGDSGTGTVTSDSSEEDSEGGAAGYVSFPRLNVGAIQVGAYIFGAALTGAGMILL